MTKDLENLVDQIVEWMRTCVKEAGAQGLIYGLSGGIDSALLAALAQIAFPNNSLALILPCHSSKKDEEDAYLVADKFKLKIKKIDLSELYDHFLKISFYSDSDLARSNIKPRLRMAMLYYYGQDLSYLTLGGTNKSEYFIGYFTKYGDGGVDLMPLADLSKTQVIQLAKFLGVPDEIIEKKPSAGLIKGQTDEDDLGFTYEYLDGKLESDSWTDNNLDKDIMKRHETTRHKRNMPKKFIY